MAGTTIPDLYDDFDPFSVLNDTQDREQYDPEKEFKLLQEMCVDRLPWWPPERMQHGY